MMINITIHESPFMQQQIKLKHRIYVSIGKRQIYVAKNANSKITKKPEKCPTKNKWINLTSPLHPRTDLEEIHKQKRGGVQIVV
jgi:hypothetical protein